MFDVYLAKGNIPKACDTIEKLVDIDAYDHRNQERIQRLHGNVDDNFLKRIGGRMAKSGGVEAAAASPARQQSSDSGLAGGGTDEARKMQALEDLIVQTEIFLQYSLQAKAMERLQKIAAMFPGEEERHVRLRNLVCRRTADCVSNRQRQNLSRQRPQHRHLQRRCQCRRRVTNRSALGLRIKAGRIRRRRCETCRRSRRSIRRFSGSRRRERC